MEDCKYHVGDTVRIVDHDTLIKRGYQRVFGGFTKQDYVGWANDMDMWINTTATILRIYSVSDDPEGVYRVTLSQTTSNTPSITESWAVTTDFIELCKAFVAPNIDELLALDGEYVQSVRSYRKGYHVGDYVYWLDKSGEWGIIPYTSTVWMKYNMSSSYATTFPQLRLGDDYIVLDKDKHILDRFIHTFETSPQVYSNADSICVLRHKQIYRTFNDDDFVMFVDGSIKQVKDLAAPIKTNVPVYYRYLDGRYVEKHNIIMSGSLTGEIKYKDTTDRMDITTLAADMNDDDVTVYVKNDRVFTSDNDFIILKEVYKYVG